MHPNVLSMLGYNTPKRGLKVLCFRNMCLNVFLAVFRCIIMIWCNKQWDCDYIHSNRHHNSLLGLLNIRFKGDDKKSVHNFYITDNLNNLYYANETISYTFLSVGFELNEHLITKTVFLVVITLHKLVFGYFHTLLQVKCVYLMHVKLLNHIWFYRSYDFDIIIKFYFASSISFPFKIRVITSVLDIFSWPSFTHL